MVGRKGRLARGDVAEMTNAKLEVEAITDK